MRSHGSAPGHFAGCSVLRQAAPARKYLPAAAGTTWGSSAFGCNARRPNYRTAKAVTWLRENFEKTMNVDDLASMTGVSKSTLHHHFRGLTAMSPLQFQKRLCCTAEYAYKRNRRCECSLCGRLRKSEPNQSEYKRLFGNPPNARCAGIASVPGDCDSAPTINKKLKDVKTRAAITKICEKGLQENRKGTSPRRQARIT